MAATGVLSVPFYPNVPGRESFRGEAYHTGLWPKTEVANPYRSKIDTVSWLFWSV